ncbi:MAG TPA: DUF2508 family protein [Peptostreptococcaceae bacterium]|nr:DUF2508 family protein [Peptostreptococcaceae bacterium]
MPRFLRRNTKEKQDMAIEIKRAYSDVKIAEIFFQNVIEPELIDVAIFELEARKSRYSYLLKQAKQKGVSYDCSEDFIKVIAK